MPAAAVASATLPSSLQEFRNGLRTHLEDLRYAAIVALSADQFEEGAHDLEGLRTTRDFDECNDRRWYHSERHQMRACRSVGHAIGNLSEKQRKGRISGSRTAVKAMFRSGQFITDIPRADRRALATRVHSAVSTAFTDLGVKLGDSMRDSESETLTLCGPPVSGQAVECSLGRMISFFSQTLPEEFRHARLELEQVVREANTQVDAYLE